MPGIIPSYLYTIMASIIVGSIVVATCAYSAVAVKAEAEAQQLLNIEDYVVAESIFLQRTTRGNVTSRMLLDVPPLIGNHRYWIQIQNDTSHVWAKAGLGVSVVPSEKGTSIPCKVLASGFCVSGSGPAFLEYRTSENGDFLTLIGGNS
jgi:hypothetical protein